MLKTARLLFVVVSLTILIHTALYASELPTLGNASSAIISQQQEYELGHVFLKMLNKQAKTLNDPEITHYTETLIYRLAESSELKDHRLSLVMIDNAQLNAFAAPGGIIGINTGLFLYAESEQEFASVIAHELAHLSQRHYARQVEAAQQQRIPSMAAILGSIILMAVGGGEAGIAALTTTIAGMQSQQLRFSRQNEQEADRVGIRNMARANFDPHAMPKLFERMSRMEGSAPQLEFLRTHPVSGNRVADAKGRAEQYSVRHYQDSPSYSPIRMRAIVKAAKSPEYIAQQLKNDLQTGRSSHHLHTIRYGLALAQLESNNASKAAKTLQPLLASSPDNVYYRILGNQIKFAQGQHQKAMTDIKKMLRFTPDNHPLTMTYANMLFQNQQYQAASKTLKRFTRFRPEDPEVWYQLAEAAGKAGDIEEVHKARAEFFFLIGNFDDAIKHLDYAAERADTPFSTKVAIKERITEIQTYKNRMKL
ncbi:MAG: M48 family metallopeptidase [Endozoicomonadaceae bacterium]|nr:M48 family metallopeptidase [Endozoicomonadaceae bacterium]